jgi:two-component system sensor histidine kinase PilS (NtrC family)|tara:strand:+ start:2179 stop:3804 length:1626 start_codon:yes stop_codon:yes gene_type:complete
VSTHRAEILAEIDRRRFGLGAGLLKIYNYYRGLLGLSLLAVFFQATIETRIGIVYRELFVLVAIGYTLINLISAVALQFLPPRLISHRRLSFLLVCYDIASLTTMMLLSGGVGSGLGVLILVTVACGAIIVTGRAAPLVPALASIAVLFEESYLALSLPSAQYDYFQAGILGILYFAFWYTIQTLSNRIRENDIRALTQAAELADLERINRLIVQRMRTGIVLVDHKNNIRMSNQSARGLLGERPDNELTRLPVMLLERLERWRNDLTMRSPPFQADAATPEVRANFLPVRPNDAYGDVTIFIEDIGEIQQQAQQLKLASIGRLSASIAHEIRNPLGAISHAAQLLHESDSLDQGDERLTEIIHAHCIRMNDVIENVLDMSRRIKPSPERMNLKAQVENFRDEFRETAKEAEIVIDISPSETEIRMDPSQLRQVLTNLVTNGIRYSRQRTGCSWVRIAGGIDVLTERPYLSIEDDGLGVPAENVANLFEPIFTTETSGTGLGLYVSRELCESNQARLSYSPLRGHGSCFRITFTHPDRLTA